MDRRELLKKVATMAAAVGVGGVVGCGRKTEGTAGAPLPTGETKGQPKAPAAENQQAGAAHTSASLGSYRTFDKPPANVHAAVAEDRKPAELVSAAIEAYGGRDAIFQSGDTVVIKPNLAWARQPDVGATTHPKILKAVIGMARDAGAEEVLVVEHSCDNSMIAFDASGGRQACDEMNVPLISINKESMFQDCEINGQYLHKTSIANDILQSDVYVNLPCAKHHSATTVTIAMKNQMGCVLKRQPYHQTGSSGYASSGYEGSDDHEQGSEPEKRHAHSGTNLDQNIADLAAALQPTINIVDATRVLKTNGPKGPGELQQTNTVIVTHDMVTADALGAKMLGHSPEDIPHIEIAEHAGVGIGDLEELDVARV